MESLQYLSLKNLDDTDYNALPFTIIKQFFVRRENKFQLRSYKEMCSIELLCRFDRQEAFVTTLNNFFVPFSQMNETAEKIAPLDNADWSTIHLYTPSINNKTEIISLRDCMYKTYGFYNAETLNYDLCRKCAPTEEFNVADEVSIDTVAGFCNNILNKQKYWCSKCWKAPLFSCALCESYDCAIQILGDDEVYNTIRNYYANN